MASWVLAVAAGCATAQPLPALVRQALAADPAVAGAWAQLRAAQERVTQAQAGFGPTAVLTGSLNETRYDEQPQLNLREFRAKQLALQITQPLFRPALLPALAGARAQARQGEAAVVQAQADAAQRVLEATFELFKGRDTLALTLAQQAAGAEQLAAARRAFQVGTVAIVDVREAEARVDGVAAQVIGARAELALQQQVLAELVGQPTPDLLRRGLDGSQLPVLPAASILEWLADARLLNPQIAQARHAVEASEAELGKARLGHAPTAELTYNHSLSSDTGTITAVFPRSGTAGTVGLSINVPLFASGATESRVRETIALRDKAQADLQAAERTVTLAVRQNHAATLTALARAQGLEAAVRSQDLALRAARRGYAVGMKINTDVLDAQSRLFEARRDLAHARVEAWLRFTRLQVQAGQLTANQLDALEAALVNVPEQPALLVEPPARAPAAAASRP